MVTRLGGVVIFAAIIVGLVLCALLGALLEDGCLAFMGGCGVTR